jgi:hypothetical protein
MTLLGGGNSSSSGSFAAKHNGNMEQTVKRWKKKIIKRLGMVLSIDMVEKFGNFRFQRTGNDGWICLTTGDAATQYGWWWCVKEGGRIPHVDLQTPSPSLPRW